MNKIVLMIFLCLSLQACSNGAGNLKSNGAGDSKSDIPSILNNEPEEKQQSGLLAISEFMAVMSAIKTHTL